MAVQSLSWLESLLQKALPEPNLIKGGGDGAVLALALHCKLPPLQPHTGRPFLADHLQYWSVSNTQCKSCVHSNKPFRNGVCQKGSRPISQLHLQTTFYCWGCTRT